MDVPAKPHEVIGQLNSGDCLAKLLFGKQATDDPGWLGEKETRIHVVIQYTDEVECTKAARGKSWVEVQKLFG